MSALALTALLPFAGALAPALAIRWGRDACALAAALVTGSALLLLLTMAPQVLAGQVVKTGIAWLPELGLSLSLRLDALSLLFAGMILGIGFLFVVYARFYLAKADPMGRFFVYLLLFQGAMLGVALLDNVLVLLVFWELTSLTSFLLIGYWRDRPEARQGARMALVVTGGGGLCLIAGMLLLGTMAGSFDLSVILSRREAVQASPLYTPALVLILLGCFTKSAQFPFHFWLPHAMAAPTPVSAYLHSATMVKAGVFLLARLWPVLSGTPEWFYLVAGTGLATLLVGAAVALFKDDLKALLAYSTVSHLGLLTLLLGLGTATAAVAAVVHLISHALFKAALFMNAGAVEHEAGSRDLRRLGGLLALMPMSGVVGLLAAASMAGLPPMSGFLSKEMMLHEASSTVFAGQAWLVPAAATLGALLSAAYAFRYAAGVWLGDRRSEAAAAAHEGAWGLWAPPLVLAVLALALGLQPGLIEGLVAAVAQNVVGPAADIKVHLALWHGVNTALVLSLIALIGGAGLLAVHGRAEALWRAIPMPEAKALFDAAMAGLVGFSRSVSGRVHAPSLQRSLGLLTIAALAAALSGAGWGGTVLLAPDLPSAPFLAFVVWALLIAACAGVVMTHHRRFTALIFVSLAGLIVSLAFLYFSAPDLALTQITVEVVTVLLLLLALNLMPKTSPPGPGFWRMARDGALSLAAGAGAAAASWIVLTRERPGLAAYFWDNAYSGGGGTNVVNVILVDFRGFDTFGEIIVLAVAALGIFAMLESVTRGASGRRLAQWRPDQARSPERHPMMLVVATRVLFPLVVLTAVYIFLRGHNQPGGGFIAGLAIAAALLMQYLASGHAWAERRQRIDHHTLIGSGVLIAAATGAASLLFGAPFLTSAFGYLDWPVVGRFEVASAMAFDLGVALTVAGAVVLALSQLARVAQRAEKPAPTDLPMDVDPSRAPSVAEGAP